jgi:hypothetical protein
VIKGCGLKGKVIDLSLIGRNVVEIYVLSQFVDEVTVALMQRHFKRIQYQLNGFVDGSKQEMACEKRVAVLIGRNQHSQIRECALSDFNPKLIERIIERVQRKLGNAHTPSAMQAADVNDVNQMVDHEPDTKSNSNDDGPAL